MRTARPLRNGWIFVSFLLLAASTLVVGLIEIPWQQTSTGFGRVVAFSPDERIQSVDAPPLRPHQSLVRAGGRHR